MVPSSVKPFDKTLKTRAFRSSAWTTAGYGIGQALRFAGNLVLAWFLVPEDFGLMALVTIFLQALQMFSDIGIGPSLIQNRRDDAGFVNTVWTIQVLRGLILWLVACLIAWPVSVIWRAPELVYLLPVAGVTAIIHGFASTHLFTLQRRLLTKPQAILEPAAQLVGLLAMVFWVSYPVSRSVWALVAGGIVSSCFRTLATHFLLKGVGNRFYLDRAAVWELIRFGRWLFLSTIITFLAAQTANLIYGVLMSPAALGVFWIGIQLALVLPNLVKQIGGRVVFPLLSEVYRRDQSTFGHRLLRVRMLVVIPSVLGLGVLAWISMLFFDLLLPDRFLGAAWVVQVMAINSMAGMVNSSYGHAYLASGRTLSNMVSVAGQLVIVVVSTLAGYYIGGESGFIIGLGISQWLKYPLDGALAASGGFWQWKFDVSILVLSVMLALLSLWGSNWMIRTWVL